MAMKKTNPTSTIKKTTSAKAASKSKATNGATKTGGKMSAKPAAKASAKPAAKAKPASTARKAPAVAKAPAKAAAKPKAAKRTPAIMHWEIQSKQPETLHKFYGEVFGWNIDANNPMNYGMVSSKGANGGIDGGIGGSQDSSARVLVYASVSSIPAILKRVEERGGKTIMPRTDIGPVVMAIYLDPEGNTMGLIEDT